MKYTAGAHSGGSIPPPPHNKKRAREEIWINKCLKTARENGS